MIRAAPQARDNQGAPNPRIDARLKVTGEALYAADIALNHLAHAALVTSDIARGEVKSISFHAARSSQGVLDIISYEDIEGLRKPRLSTSSYTSLGPLHQRTIYHDGQIVALVVADTLEAAEHAASRVAVEYSRDTPTAGFDSPGTTQMDAAGKVALLDEDPCVGDFGTAFQSAKVKIETDYATPHQTHNPIELFSTTAVWSDDVVTIYEPTQSVYGFRAEIAHQLGVDVTKVRVVSPYVGGGFGSKGPSTPRSALVALAARRLGRPVRCVVSRSQAFTTLPYRAPTRHHIKLGASAAGKIQAYSHDAWELTSRVDNYAVGGTDTTARMYAYGAVRSHVRLVKADRQTPAYMRSPPELPYMFPLESALDELAHALEIDPVELRLKNDTEKDPISGKPFSSRHLKECYERGVQEFGWKKRNPAPRSMREGDWLIGLGCATAVYPTNVAVATARVRLDATGHVRVQSASQEIGTGIRTVAGQMAAEQLGVDLSNVTVEMGDTDLPAAPTSGGSNSTASVCSAVLNACEKIRARLRQAGATGPNTGDLPGLFVKLGVGVIEEYGEFVPEGLPPDALQKLYAGQTTMVSGTDRKQVMFAFGAEFVEVRINARTHEIRVPRLLGVFAAGRIMNTRTARSQLMGGLIWGMSAALHEATEVDPRHARIVNRDLQDYLVPVNADVDQVEVIMLPEVDTAVNPAGIKGLGELGNVGTNAAVANAVFHATGVRVRTLPIRLEDLAVAL
jgi:xanthine dehydrogenase YagR molybdenum-binding subunit